MTADELSLLGGGYYDPPPYHTRNYVSNSNYYRRFPLK